ncbi:MAG: DUF1178 family protein [Desulfobacteraceae bacterium]|jgi:hypothetical protein
MIVFDLECSKGHRFEGWFNNTQSFEEQNAKRLVSCPYCNDTRVKRILSPVATKTSTRVDAEKDVEPIDYRRLAKEIVEYVNENFDNVGPDFAKEALKMHYGVAEKRNIRGSATAEEEKIMKKENIEFFKVPIPKIDDDKKN